MLREIDASTRDEVNRFLSKEWGCPPSVSKGVAIDTTKIPGFVWIEDDKIEGIVTYHIVDKECEIVTLNSFLENRGIATAFIDAVKTKAVEQGCRRVWLITTNDDINAIGFYQKRGMEMVAMYRNSLEVSRKIKPSIPLYGMDGIPIKHEIEFEIIL